MARSRLGPLALETQLGGDPAGTVWRAIHVEQRKTLAVKIFHLPFGGTLEARQEFSREWETLKRLRHGGIARCFGGGFEDNDAYLAYELINGDSLQERVERRDRLPWEAVLDDAEALAEAIAYAHDRQVVHGNLVPDKIRTAGLAPTILDFRVDRFGSPYRPLRPPTPFELGFRAPELLREVRALSAKADLYSLGALLFYALSGRPPVVGDTLPAITESAEREPIPKVATIVLDCPVWLSSLIEQLLEKNPQARPHSAGAVCLALREVRKRAMEGIGVAQHAAGGFSALRVDVDKAEAKALLGHLPEEPEKEPDGTEWYERPWALVAALLCIGLFVTWYLWPLNEAQLRARAESLLADGSRTALGQAKDDYLEPLVRKHPDSENAAWAREQIEMIEMLEAERQLDLKLRRGAKLTSEGERLYATGLSYEQFGDNASALDKYKSLVTLLGDEEDQLPFVNLARRQIAKIETNGGGAGERVKLVTQKLEEADALMSQGKAVEARKIWYSILELYQSNKDMETLVAIAQQRLAGDASGPQVPPAASPSND